jgi:hypothetical protein
MVNNIKAWKSTILGILLIVFLTIGLITEKLSDEAFIAYVPAVMLVLTNLFKENKDEECNS